MPKGTLISTDILLITHLVISILHTDTNKSLILWSHLFTFHLFLQRGAKPALQVTVWAYMLRQISLSVRPSVTLRYYVKMRERRGIRFSPPGSPVSRFLMASGRVSPLTSPKWGSDTQTRCFRRNFDQKPLKVCYKVSLSKTPSSKV